MKRRRTPTAALPFITLVVGACGSNPTGCRPLGRTEDDKFLRIRHHLLQLGSGGVLRSIRLPGQRYLQFFGTFGHPSAH
jgi:hypothetical protein